MLKSQKFTTAYFAISDFAATLTIALSVVGFFISPFAIPMYYAYELHGQQPGTLEIPLIMAAYAIAGIGAVLHRQRRPVCLVLFVLLIAGLLATRNVAISAVAFLLVFPPWFLVYLESRKGALSESG